ncbi:hypothetical protein [Streptomyces virginiae]|uniref:hypothetical protein n=1 Tax=Streptomyces virginiae TaxID=1961 RepID=UPI002DBE69E5|nr:hypothetical protein [Streptomyces sp. CMAA1738]MEC4575306.1 hypothetical protein [Streptomyces sp. CMAA1738]
MEVTGNNVVLNLQGQNNMKHVEPDDFIIHLRSFQGGLERATITGKVSTAYTVLTPRNGVVADYYRWLLKSDGYIQELRTTTNQLRDGQSIKYRDFVKVVLPVPPEDEQQAIANYLDRETTQIDTLIAEQRRLVEMMKKRILSFNDQCFYGADGKRTVLLKRVLRRIDRPAFPGLGVVTAYRDGAVTLRSNRREEGYTFSEKEDGYQEVRPGDLVFHGLDGFAGAVGISDSHGNATPVYHVCETIAGDDPEYVAFLLRYLGTSGFLATQAPNVRQRAVDFRNWAMFARIPLSLPDFATQRSVVRNIREQTARTDTLIAESERLIELSQERRAALITAAVTGQMDVRREG